MAARFSHTKHAGPAIGISAGWPQPSHTSCRPAQAVAAVDAAREPAG
jgi:hypothetical protein